jgi:hypothetical protein
MGEVVRLRGISTDHEFDLFYKNYPRKRARADARRAFKRARQLATLDEILAGVDRLLANMPAERRFVPYPATWLRAEQWADEHETEDGRALDFSFLDSGDE